MVVIYVWDSGVCLYASASSSLGIALRRVGFREQPLNLDRQELERAIQDAEEQREFWRGRAAHCRKALQLMRQALPQVYPGSREELDYVLFKTENFVTAFELLTTVQETRSAFDQALLASMEGQIDQAAALLEQSREALERAQRLARRTAEQMIPYAHIPTERHILWIFNKALPSYEETKRYLNEVITIHQAIAACGYGIKEAGENRG